MTSAKELAQEAATLRKRLEDREAQLLEGKLALGYARQLLGQITSLQMHSEVESDGIPVRIMKCYGNLFDSIVTEARR